MLIKSVKEDNKDFIFFDISDKQIKDCLKNGTITIMDRISFNKKHLLFGYYCGFWVVCAPSPVNKYFRFSYEQYDESIKCFNSFKNAFTREKSDLILI